MKNKTNSKWLLRQSKPYRVKVTIKKSFFQKFCRHEYVQGELSNVKDKTFLNLDGERISIVCTKCGHIHSSYFRPTGDTFL